MQWLIEVSRKCHFVTGKFCQSPCRHPTPMKIDGRRPRTAGTQGTYRGTCTPVQALRALQHLPTSTGARTRFRIGSWGNAIINNNNNIIPFVAYHCCSNKTSADRFSIQVPTLIGTPLVFWVHYRLVVVETLSKLRACPTPENSRVSPSEPLFSSIFCLVVVICIPWKSLVGFTTLSPPLLLRLKKSSFFLSLFLFSFVDSRDWSGHEKGRRRCRAFWWYLGKSV